LIEGVGGCSQFVAQGLESDVTGGSSIHLAPQIVAGGFQISDPGINGFQFDFLAQLEFQL